MVEDCNSGVTGGAAYYISFRLCTAGRWWAMYYRVIEKGTSNRMFLFVTSDPEGARTLDLRRDRLNAVNEGHPLNSSITTPDSIYFGTCFINFYFCSKVALSEKSIVS